MSVQIRDTAKSGFTTREARAAVAAAPSPLAGTPGGERTIRWESLVTPVAAVLGGLGLSVWLTYLDYRRRLPGAGRSRPTRSRGRLLDTGLGLLALGLLLRRITGAEKGWTAIACYLPALAGITLLAAHMTRLLASASDDGGGKPREKE